ncbi:MAG: hypothetical protein HY692_07675 [Cyanobacteria bacterium NC_groundwater_1444_Ag_S-0.65um_54_12]|nr:hypothetical protein [Cyanobacteria bacterium NC_groundwater_1444_Ag_S-0.65um_54_12]
MNIDARARRLYSDHEKVLALLAKNHDALLLERTGGSPPAAYWLLYRCRGIAKLAENEPVFRTTHQLELRLPSSYPLQSPSVHVNTPIFHPHVFENGDVCLGARWQVGEGLDNLLIRIGAILRYEPVYLDFDSAANREAAKWAQQHLALFPLDPDPFAASTGPVAIPERSISWVDTPGMNEK